MITIKFSQSDIDALHKGRFDHPDKQVRRKMEVLYLKSQKVSHGLICKLMRISKTRYLLTSGTLSITGLRTSQEGTGIVLKANWKLIQTKSKRSSKQILPRRLTKRLIESKNLPA